MSRILMTASRSDDWPRLLQAARETALTAYPGPIGEVLAAEFARTLDGVRAGEPVWFERHAVRCRAAFHVLADAGIDPTTLDAR